MTTKIRSKYYSLVLYPLEDSSHKKAIDYIVKNYEYALIVHDKDTNENNELIKPHTHIVIKFTNYKWLNSLQKELDISINYIEKSDSLESALLYLVHYNNKEKFQYSTNEVSGSLRLLLENYIKKKTHSSEDMEVLLILEIIEDMPPYNDLYLLNKDFVRIICENNLYSIFRRNSYYFIKLLELHNRL